MIKEKYGNSHCAREKDVGRYRVTNGVEKDKIEALEETVVEKKESGRTLPSFYCGRNTFPVNLQALCGKFLQFFDAAPVEETDDDTLPPVDPEEGSDVPVLDHGQNDYSDVGEKEKQGIRAQFSQ